MGITVEQWKLFKISLKKAFGSMDMSGLRMCELGNQEFKLRLRKTKGRVAKKYFSKVGVDHTSIDLNGHDGALQVDLSMPINISFEPFDIITNFGTTEHVENQYECFKNIHYLTREGGLMFHAVPHARSWPVNHGFFRYPLKSFHMMSKLAGYRVVLSKTINYNNHRGRKLACVGLVKDSVGDFVDKDVFSSIEIQKYVK